MSANERRAEIMRIMVARRQENMQVLAAELDVTDRTIRNDILVLTAEYPLETTRGNGGGVLDCRTILVRAVFTEHLVKHFFLFIISLVHQLFQNRNLIL